MGSVRAWPSEGLPAAGGGLPTAVVVPLVIDNPGPVATGQPVTVGVPFPRGALLHAGSLQLLNPRGESVRLQALPLARWPDGTVRWLVLDFVAESVPAGSSHWTLQPGRDTTASV